MFVERTRSVLSNRIVQICIIGIAIRIVIGIFLTLVYDTSHWIRVSANIASEFGLYGVPGYYYPPIWGYLLSSIMSVGKYIFGIEIFSLNPDSMILVADSYGYMWTPTFAYLALLKGFLTLMDLIAGLLIYKIVMISTNDEKKATVGFAVWFLCPLVFVVSCASTMFESVAVIFMLLTLLFVSKDRYALAGMAFSLAVCTKVFPVYIMFVLVSYVLIKNRDSLKTGLTNLSTSIVAAIITFIMICIPQIFYGSTNNIFKGITERFGTVDSGIVMDYSAFVILQPMVIVFAIMMGFLLYFYAKNHRADELNSCFFMVSLLTMTVVLMVPAGSPSYYVFAIPAFAYCIAARNLRYVFPLLLMSIAYVVVIFGNPIPFLYTFAVNTNMLNLNHLVELANTVAIEDTIPLKIIGTSGIWIFLLDMAYHSSLFRRRPDEEN
ncbi:MAG: hypothetical protein WC248_00135 [Candidatus Methanomethylophilaceae archaeon]|jgi:hypothetical protein